MSESSQRRGTSVYGSILNRENEILNIVIYLLWCHSTRNVSKIQWKMENGVSMFPTSRPIFVTLCVERRNSTRFVLSSKRNQFSSRNRTHSPHLNGQTLSSRKKIYGQSFAYPDCSIRDGCSEQMQHTQSARKVYQSRFGAILCG